MSDVKSMDIYTADTVARTKSMINFALRFLTNHTFLRVAIHRPSR